MWTIYMWLAGVCRVEKRITESCETEGRTTVDWRDKVDRLRKGGRSACWRYCGSVARTQPLCCGLC